MRGALVTRSTNDNYGIPTDKIYRHTPRMHKIQLRRSLKIHKLEGKTKKTAVMLMCSERDISTPYFSVACWMWFILRQTDRIRQVQWHRLTRQRETEGDKQTWRWRRWCCCCWCCPVLRGCSPILGWPRVRRRWGHVVKTSWVHSWSTDGQQKETDADSRSEEVSVRLKN